MVMALFDEGRKRRMRDAIAKGNPVVFQQSAKGSEGLTGGEKPSPGPEMREALNSQLLIAAEAGEFQHALEALDRGADPDARDANGTPAIMVAGNAYYARSQWACQYSVVDMSVPNDRRNLDGVDRTAALLLERGADPNAMDARGHTVFDLDLRMPCIFRLSGKNP